jgi:hypothetical protein
MMMSMMMIMPIVIMMMMIKEIVMSKHTSERETEFDAINERRLNFVDPL